MSARRHGARDDQPIRSWVVPVVVAVAVTVLVAVAVIAISSGQRFL